MSNQPERMLPHSGELCALAFKNFRSVTYAGKFFTHRVFEAAVNEFKSLADHETLLNCARRATLAYESMLITGRVRSNDKLGLLVDDATAELLTEFLFVARGCDPELPFVAVFELWMGYRKHKGSVMDRLTFSRLHSFTNLEMMTYVTLFAVIQPTARTHDFKSWYRDREQVIAEKERDWIVRLYRHFESKCAE